MAEIIHLDICTSTMDEAKRLGRDGAPHGTVVAAKTMTAGRGQHGRAWQAPPGGLYLSMVLRDVANPRLATLAIGNAVCDALEVAGIEAQVKWVNDILVDGQKIAGILAEGEATGDTLDFIIVGVGLNIRTAPDDVAATSMDACLGAPQCIEDMEMLVVEHIHRWLHRLRDAPTEVISAWENRHQMVGARVAVEDGPAGIIIGIDPSGDLLLDVNGTLTPVNTGSITRI